MSFLNCVHRWDSSRWHLARLITMIVMSALYYQMSATYKVRETGYHGLVSRPLILLPPNWKIFHTLPIFVALITDSMRQGSYFIFCWASFDTANTNLSNFTNISDYYHVQFIYFTIFSTKSSSETRHPVLLLYTIVTVHSLPCLKSKKDRVVMEIVWISSASPCLYFLLQATSNLWQPQIIFILRYCSYSEYEIAMITTHCYI